jgi:hypothetical protein
MKAVAPTPRREHTALSRSERERASCTVCGWAPDALKDERWQSACGRREARSRRAPRVGGPHAH